MQHDNKVVCYHPYDFYPIQMRVVLPEQAPPFIDISQQPFHCDICRDSHEEACSFCKLATVKSHNTPVGSSFCIQVGAVLRSGTACKHVTEIIMLDDRMQQKTQAM